MNTAFRISWARAVTGMNAAFGINHSPFISTVVTRGANDIGILTE
jgi:hypothetical protein